MTRPIVELWTDGSCKDGTGGWAFCLVCGKQDLCGNGGEKDTTNNRMELQAVINGLKKLTEDCVIHLYSDSQYVLRGMSCMYIWAAYNWKKKDGDDVKNSDLWKELLECRRGHKFHYHWVKGHVGTANNELCDSLAKIGRDKVSRDELKRQLKNNKKNKRK